MGRFYVSKKLFDALLPWVRKDKGCSRAIPPQALERQLSQQGLSGRQIRVERKQVMSRRFNRVGRNTLWQADLKYGPYLPDPTHPGHKMRTFLVALIDDATRLVVHAEFYARGSFADSFAYAISCGR